MAQDVDRIKGLRKQTVKAVEKYRALYKKGGQLVTVGEETSESDSLSSQKALTEIGRHFGRARAKPKSRAARYIIKPNGQVIYMGIVSYTLRNARISPQKARLVLNEIKGENIFVAEAKLAMCKKKGARIFEKMLKCVAHEARRMGMDVSRLWIHSGWVDAGITLKRIMPAAQGRAVPIKKRYSHITIAASAV